MKLKEMMYPVKARPDEHLYSIISKIILESCITIRELKERIGAKFNFHCFNSLPVNLFEEPEQALEHTVFPYYLACLPEERGKEVRENFIQGKYQSFQGLPHGMLKEKAEQLKVCPDCMDEERKAYGWPYLHTEHQIEGIHACSRHGKKLEGVKLDYGKPLYSIEVESGPAGELDIKIAGKTGELPGLNNEILISGYRRLMEREDCCIPEKTRNAFDLWRFYQILQDKAGKKWLKSMGLALDRESCTRRNSWLMKLIGRGNCGNINPPVVHLLMFAVFDLDRTFFLNEPEAKKTILCKNPYCGGDAEYVGTDHLRDYYRCPDCQMVISGSRRIMQTGELWRERTVQELKKGIAISTLSKEQGFYPDFVKRWLARDPLELDHRCEDFMAVARKYDNRKTFIEQEPNKYKLLKALHSDFLDRHFGLPPHPGSDVKAKIARKKKSRSLSDLNRRWKELTESELSPGEHTKKEICTKLGVRYDTLKRDYPEIYEKIQPYLKKRSINQSLKMTRNWQERKTA